MENRLGQLGGRGVCAASKCRNTSMPNLIDVEIMPVKTLVSRYRPLWRHRIWQLCFGECRPNRVSN